MESQGQKMSGHRCCRWLTGVFVYGAAGGGGGGIISSCLKSEACQGLKIVSPTCGPGNQDIVAKKRPTIWEPKC